MPKTKELRGPALLCAAVNEILAHPETWDQSTWHCGTTHCIAGHCEILATGKETSDPSIKVGELLGLGEMDRRWLFSGHRTLPEIYGFAKTFRDGYNRDGYNRDGYDSDGYDRDGYNRAGYDSAGYNRAGYNRDGYDSAGYNRAGAKLELVPFEI